jgi:ribonuclease P protein component
MRPRFTKAQRLNVPAEFDRVRREGTKQRGNLISLGVFQPGEGPARAGFVTSKKIGGAVVRNRVRRQLREIVRKHQHEITGGTWIVVIANRTAGTAGYAALEGEWLRLAGRASILAPSCAG